MRLAALLLSVTIPASAAPDAAEIITSTGIEAGLAVHVGATDGALECGLTSKGRMLVHGLALADAQRDAARQAIFSKNLYGLASVATWRDRSRLPYASNLANLLVADLDALGDAAPAPAELERVVAPEGVLFLRKNGAWSKTVKPRPAGMDDWGHFDHDALGLGASGDALVDPVRQQQWITTLAPLFSFADGEYEAGGGLRLSGRYAVMGAINWRGKGQAAKKLLHCRDAFNGTPLWTVETDELQSRWEISAADGAAYTWLKRDGELTAISLATGKTIRTFPGTLLPKKMGDSAVLSVRVSGKHLLVGLPDRLACFDLGTGAERWSYARKDLQPLRPVLDAARGRVYVILAEPGKRWDSRWPTSANVASVVALDLATGRPVWECAEVASIEVPAPDAKGRASTRGIGQLLPGDKHLVVFGSVAIGGGVSPYIGSIDLATGKVVHHTDKPFRASYNVASYNAIWRDGSVYFAGAYSNIWRFDPATGEVQPVHGMGFNQRCTPIVATPRWLVFGQVGYFGQDGGGVQVSVARSGCAYPSVPANGMTYFTPTKCGCTTLVRGFQAMTGEAAPPPVPDATRLVAGGGQPLVLSAGNEPPSGPVATDWPAQAGDPVKAGDLEIVVIPNQHRIEARRGGKAVWSYVAGARITSPPVIAGGAAIFGSHDGWVHAVGSDGRLRWKYLLAPSERLIGVQGQIESSWPVYGVALLDGKVVASAGTHVELGGGVTVAAFDPATGQPAWIKHLAKPPSVVPPGGKGANIVAYSFINSVPRIVDGVIHLGGGERKDGDFAFSPGDEETALNTRLAEPPAKKK